MTVAISVGTRFPAFATSMGRVLLAALTEDELDRYLAEATLEPFTADTVTDPAQLRGIVREVGQAGLRDRRPGARGGPARDRRADPRRRRRR